MTEKNMQKCDEILRLKTTFSSRQKIFVFEKWKIVFIKRASRLKVEQRESRVGQMYFSPPPIPNTPPRHPSKPGIFSLFPRHFSLCLLCTQKRYFIPTSKTKIYLQYYPIDPLIPAKTSIQESDTRLQEQPKEILSPMSDVEIL